MAPHRLIESTETLRGQWQTATEDVTICSPALPKTTWKYMLGMEPAHGGVVPEGTVVGTMCMWDTINSVDMFCSDLAGYVDMETGEIRAQLIEPCETNPDATCVYDTFTGTVTARGELSMWKSSTKTALFSDGGSLLSRLKLAKVANQPDTGLVGPLPVLANLFYKP